MTTNTDSKEKPQTQSDALESPNDYQKALALAELGRHAEALAAIEEYLRTSPDNAEVLNDAGAILHCLGRSDEAIERFVKARNLQPDSAEILWNLTETYLAVGRAKDAMELFDDMQRFSILNADVLNRAATSLLDEHDKANAIDKVVEHARKELLK